MNQYPHVVEIQEFSKVSDGGGGHTQTWVKVKDVECMVTAASGREYYQAQQIKNPITYNIFMEYDPDIKPKMRAMFGGQILNITSALPMFPDINGEWEKLNLKCSS